ncbi:MAG TPA: hypothetical protein VGI98_01255 [Candidatus Limnocylindrales bacterium]|jgi:hypothetical protein
MGRADVRRAAAVVTAMGAAVVLATGVRAAAIYQGQPGEASVIDQLLGLLPTLLTGAAVLAGILGIGIWIGRLGDMGGRRSVIAGLIAGTVVGLAIGRSEVPGAAGGGLGAALAEGSAVGLLVVLGTGLFVVAVVAWLVSQRVTTPIRAVLLAIPALAIGLVAGLASSA